MRERADTSELVMLLPPGGCKRLGRVIDIHVRDERSAPTVEVQQRDRPDELAGHGRGRCKHAEVPRDGVDEARFLLTS
jgi:hypothetical protein